MQSPCCECPHRKLTCHDRCPEYLSYNEEKLRAKQSFKDKHEADDFTIKGVYKRRRGAYIR